MVHDPKSWTRLGLALVTLPPTLPPFIDLTDAKCIVSVSGESNGQLEDGGCHGSFASRNFACGVRASCYRIAARDITWPHSCQDTEPRTVSTRFHRRVSLHTQKHATRHRHTIVHKGNDAHTLTYTLPPHYTRNLPIMQFPSLDAHSRPQHTESIPGKRSSYLTAW